MDGILGGPDGPGILEAWKRGVGEFNAGNFWQAHEHWEKGWNRLPSPHRENIQYLIQAVAVFHLIGVGRVEPAQRLCRSALEKRDSVRLRGPIPRTAPWIEVPGLEELLQELPMIPERELLENPEPSLARARSLRAALMPGH